jgi:hypothetical protein
MILLKIIRKENNMRNQFGSKYEKEGYWFKVVNDRNELCFVTPVRHNASEFVWEKLGYKPDRCSLDILLGGMFRIKKFIPQQNQKAEQPEVKFAKYETDPDCIGYYYGKTNEIIT